ncbi:hypothetical protein [Ruminococcus albus]|uniref:Conserved domain protein n=1 Tax=Ruminococcus albus 8 TaxID=246199 RepID=E9SEW4_RUMAL|nr:hypothetical protein [Ruminococcus albus]EGC02184.1 conserved domain protein [Ruminococcus albus 8]MCC3350793.1 hypothetical protein [Ruminococcus albus 8]
MNIYTVTFFGHRYVDNMFRIEEKLEPILKELINQKEYVEFLVGRDGEFDQIVSSAIRRKMSMDNDQKAYIYIDSKGVLQKAGDIEGLFSKAYVKVDLKDTVLKMEPVDKVGIIDQETVYFKTFYDPQFLTFII